MFQETLRSLKEFFQIRSPRVEAEIADILSKHQITKITGRTTEPIQTINFSDLKAVETTIIPEAGRLIKLVLIGDENSLEDIKTVGFNRNSLVVTSGEKGKISATMPLPPNVFTVFEELKYFDQYYSSLTLSTHLPGGGLATEYILPVGHTPTKELTEGEIARLFLLVNAHINYGGRNYAGFAEINSL